MPCLQRFAPLPQSGVGGPDDVSELFLGPGHPQAGWRFVLLLNVSLAEAVAG